MSEDEFPKEDEIITVKLPRKDYEVVRQLVRERQTYNNVVATIKAHWIWIVVAGAVGLYTLWEKFQTGVAGVIK